MRKREKKRKWEIDEENKRSREMEDGSEREWNLETENAGNVEIRMIEF